MNCTSIIYQRKGCPTGDVCHCTLSPKVDNTKITKFAFAPLSKTNVSQKVLGNFINLLLHKKSYDDGSLLELWRLYHLAYIEHKFNSGFLEFYKFHFAQGLILGEEQEFKRILIKTQSGARDLLHSFELIHDRFVSAMKIKTDITTIVCVVHFESNCNGIFLQNPKEFRKLDEGYMSFTFRLERANDSLMALVGNQEATDSTPSRAFLAMIEVFMKYMKDICERVLKLQTDLDGMSDHFQNTKAIRGSIAELIAILEDHPSSSVS
ncbi:uncharacterized protein RJT20DRAFT_148154 [Scheffersomyces xylosifermentans]|uniref:uncharacterized protein n=1 Tax=Scheffersomyces xylosifermentans TaxID=1304137 RepID=UPI00315CD28C